MSFGRASFRPNDRLGTTIESRARGLTLKIASGLILAVVLMAGCGAEKSAGPVEKPWPPAGFESWSDTIAYRWVEDPACDDGPCSHFEVVTRDGCPSSLSITLEGGSVAILTDRVVPLKPDQVSRLTLRAEHNAARRVESIDCD